MIKNVLLVGLGGGIGSMLRYLTSVCVLKFYSSSFPLATFIVNLLGCFLVGLLLGLGTKYIIFNNELKMLFLIGFCGGYTTFSAFSFENLQLLESGNYLILCFYVLVSILLGVAAVWLGSAIVK